MDDDQPDHDLINQITDEIQGNNDISEEVRDRIEYRCGVVEMEHIARAVKNMDVPGKFERWFKRQLYNVREEWEGVEQDEESISWLTTDPEITIPAGAPLGLDVAERDVPELFREYDDDEPTPDIWILVGAWKEEKGE